MPNPTPPTLGTSFNLGDRVVELRTIAVWMEGFACGIKDEQGESASDLRTKAYELREVASKIESVIGFT